MKYPFPTRKDDLHGLFQSGQEILSDFFNVLEHPDFPFVQLNSITNGAKNFPPYNIIESASGKVRLELAIAGYTKDRLKVELKSNILTISGSAADPTDDQVRHRGISNAAFLRAFELKGNAIVENVAINDGILIVTFASKIPEPENVTKFEIK